MAIEKVSIIGLGALGILFGNQLAKSMPREDLRIIADKVRKARYEQEQVFCNGRLCNFNYLTPDELCEPADLLIFAVKYNGLEAAVKAVKNQVGRHTTILSLLNGITSEAIIGQTYGMDKILYCVAQGMDAVKVGNQLTYDHMGILCFGAQETGIVSPRVKEVAAFFEQTGIPYEIDANMSKRLWGKLMLNVGVNQTVAVYEGNYGVIQKAGPARDTLVAAMQEVITLSAYEGVSLNEDDLNYWLRVLSTLSPDGKPSMRQDLEARRYSEVDLFAGTIVALGRNHGVPTPVNQQLYDRIKLIESQF